MTPAQRSMRARIAAHESWAGTVSAEQRRARTAPAKRNSPVSVEYWRRRIAEENPSYGDAEVLAAAENAHRAYMTRLSLRASQARAARRKGMSRPA